VDETRKNVTVGATFINDHDTVVVVESVDGERLVYRYVVTDSPGHLGKTDWGFVSAFSEERSWKRVD
jgi:hypothetical protein